MDDRVDQQRRHDEAQQGQLRVRGEDVDDQAEEGDRLLEEIAEARRHRGLDGVGVGDDAADHLSRRAFRKETVRLIDQPFVQLVAQVAHGGEADLLERVLGKERREGAEDEDQQHRQEHRSRLIVERLGPPPRRRALNARAQPARKPVPLPLGAVPLQDEVDHLVPRGLLARDVGRFHRLSRRRQHHVEERLDQRHHHRLRGGKDDHRAEGNDGPDLVAREIAVEPPKKFHGRMQGERWAMKGTGPMRAEW